MKEKIEHIIEKMNINTMVKEANKYESFYFIQDDWKKCIRICSEIELLINEICKDNQTDNLIQTMININKGVQLDEEAKFCPYLEVPDEIYGKEYTLVDVPFQSKYLIELLEEKIRKSFENMNFYEKVTLIILSLNF